jgi:hypothetical protein
MKAGRILISLLILSWISSAATLHLKKREIRPEGRMAGTVEDPGPRWTGGRSHLILQFRHAVNEQMLQELNRRGAYVVGSVPDFGLTLTVPDDFSVEGLDVEWAGRLGLDDKISPTLQDLRTSFGEGVAAAAETWFVAEFFPDMDMQEARRLAEAAGFRVREHPDLIAWHLLLSGSPGRLAGLAQWDEVAYVFPASRALVRGERVGHCAGALTAGGVTPMYVTASSGWTKDKGVANGQVTLSYVFGAITPKLEAAQATQEILRALNSWTQYAPIKFVAGQSATAPRTVYVWFATRDHGDGYPFDGPGGILAHTFYPAPPNQESLAGDMHLDGDENWHIGANTDLFTVALHEAGHALGLAHVDNPAAVMYPYYRLGSKIGADDIAGVQSLYGGPGGTSGAITSTAALGLTISTPAPNTSTTGSTVAVAGTTSGSQGAVQVTWQTDHGSSGIATGAPNWSVAAVPLALGSNTITVTAADSSHKAVQTASVTRTSQPANPLPGPGSPGSGTPPTLSITSPVGSVVTTSAGVIDIKGTASDNAGVSRVTWQSAAGSGTATGTTNWTASSVPLLVGNNSIIVRAYDSGGNMSWRSVLVIRN